MPERQSARVKAKDDCLASFLDNEKEAFHNMFSQSLTTPRTTRLFSVIMVVVAALVVSLAPSALAQSRLVLDSGHMNIFNVTARDGRLKLDVKEDITGTNVERPAESVLLEVYSDAYTDATRDIAGVGESGYILPQGYHQGLLRPGWTTLQARWEGFTDVNITIDEVRGPGNVYLFSADGGGGFAAPADDGDLRLHAGSTIHQANPAHLHSHWMFTRPGTYTMKATATSNGVRSNQATYTWVVGERGHDGDIMDEQLSLDRLQSLAGASVAPQPDEPPVSDPTPATMYPNRLLRVLGWG